MTEPTNHRARKRFGQNFLVDTTVIEAIIAAVATDTSDGPTIEIGPGLGALTKRLLTKLNHLEAIELDRDIIPKLKAHCEGLGELVVHNQDVLQVDFAELCPTGQKLKLIGNLPYNISTPLLFHLAQYGELISSMFFMLQKEVVDRIVAKVGTKAYGRLSVMMQYYFEVAELFTVPPEAFKPAPKVTSAVMRLVPRVKEQQLAKDEQGLAKLVAQAFSLRRKTLHNALKDMVTDEQLFAAGISPTSRAEQLSVADYVSLVNVTGQ